MGVRSMVGTVWHIETLSSKEPRRDRRSCKYYIKEDDYCRLRLAQCWGTRYCTEYVRDSNKKKTTEKKDGTSKTHVDTKKTTIPKKVRKEAVVVDRFKGNRRKILKACKEHLFDDDNLFLSDIEANNPVELWNKRGEKKVCSCGRKMDFSSDIEVKFHAGKELVSILIAGKKCVECNKIFIVKDIALESISEIKKEVEYLESIDSKYTIKGHQMKLNDLLQEAPKDGNSKVTNNMHI